MSDPPGYHDPACDARIRALNDWYWHHPLALAAFLALVVICMLPFLG
jgi:hypothetical protein